MTAEFISGDRGMEIRLIAGGYRMTTKAEYHDVVRVFAKSLKPPIRLSLQALETLAIIAYKQPVTAPEISEIRGVESVGVLATLLDRKLIGTAGRKAVIGRPILYKTTREFLLRFGLKDVGDLPSMEEFEKLAQEQTDMFVRTDAEAATAEATEAARKSDEAAQNPACEPEDAGVPSAPPSAEVPGASAFENTAPQALPEAPASETPTVQERQESVSKDA
jgi:segregation and condensation protein B